MFGVLANIGEECVHLRRSEKDLGSEVAFRMDDENSALTGLMSLTFIATHSSKFRFAVAEQYCLFTLSCFKSWDQKLSSGLLLKFMFTHLFHFRFAVSEQSCCSL